MPEAPQSPESQSNLRNAGIESALFLRRIFKCHQYGATPFATEADTLGDAQGQQRYRRPDADLFIGWYATDENGCHTHDGQRHHQHGFSPELVAEVAKDHATDGTAEKADRKRSVREHGRNQRIGTRKVELVENDARHDAVKEKVIPLNSCADEAGRNHPSYSRSFLLLQCTHVCLSSVCLRGGLVCPGITVTG
jgi:hypothetical protein